MITGLRERIAIQNAGSMKSESEMKTWTIENSTLKHNESVSSKAIINA